MILTSKNRQLDLSQPKIMAIINLTKDSFSDGGMDKSIGAVIDRISHAIDTGASIIDIGAESTRPGAKEVSLAQEIDILLPVIENIISRFDCWLSVDTYKPETMQASAQLGIDMINDISGFRNAKAIDVAVKYDLAICVMHMQGKPLNMQINPVYKDVVGEIIDFLTTQKINLIDAGLYPSNICIDPGFGFGKSLDNNYQLLANLSEIKQKVDLPLLIGTSRKSMISKLLGKATDQISAGSLTTEAIALNQGASILRVHDVEQTADMLKVWLKTQSYK